MSHPTRFSSVPPADGDTTRDDERGRRFERAIPEIIRRIIERALETGAEKISEGPDNLRSLLTDLKLPKEVLSYIYSQIDDTKKGLYRVVAKELRDVFEHTNFADEISDVLTKLSFEITTQVRFVKNPAGQPDNLGDESSGVKSESSEGSSHKSFPRPHVVSKIVMKARERLDRRTKH